MSTVIERPVVAPPTHQEAEARRRRNQVWLPRAILAPALVFSIVLTQIPFLVTIVFSTLDWDLLRPGQREFVGLANYLAVIRGGELFSSIWATVSITGLSVLLSVLLGLFFALLLDRNFPGQALARTLLITPFLVMPAAAALVWKFSMFDTNLGMLNAAWTAFGLDPVAWSTDFPLATVVIVLTWQFTPFMMLIILAGLQSQDRGVLEASAMDGAGPWRTFTWITLAHLRHYIEVAVLLGTIMLLQVFDLIAIMTKGTGGTKTLAYLLYERAFIGLNVGEAAAYGVVTVLLTIVVASIALRTLFSVFMVGAR